jgi:hypothetical protein
MSSFDQVTIGGFPDGGLVTDRKPLMLADQAFSTLQNAYAWRYRVKKREGTVSMGRLRINARVTINLIAGAKNIKTSLSLPANSTIVIGSISLVGSVDGTTYADSLLNGVLIATGGTGTGGTINYVTGDLTIAGGGAESLTGTLAYYPSFPVMGIAKQDTINQGIDNTIFFDTTFAYQYTGGAFQQLVSSTPTTWTGNNKQFFWSTNYQGTDPSVRLFFTTNNNISDPIRYYDNTSWHALTPIIADNPPSAAQSLLYQCLIIIPYYGRLLALNTFEGTTAGGSGSAANFYARCRFSQIGDPTAADAWRSDIFGKGGFLDAPTNESIVSAAFFRNTLIVFFEYSTWQLRYIGEYGLPFIFERISSDFGSSCTYSSVVFDEGVLTISDRGILRAGAGGVTRIDDQIPETVFGFEIMADDPNFVHGVRDYEKELVYWNYLETNNQAMTQSYPNMTLLFNYKNNTWAQFRDTITCFGTTQFQFGITWDSLTTFWSNESITWDSPDDQNDTIYVCAGNQQGYVFVYENQEAQTTIDSITLYAPSLYILAIDPTMSPALFTSPNHNLANGEIVYLTGALWTPTDPGINNFIYQVSVIDANTFTLSTWTGTNYAAFSITTASTYIGGGEFALFPKMNIVGKDFSPYQAQGKQFKIPYVDLQMDSDESIPSIPAITVQMFVNSYLGEQANLGGSSEFAVNSALVSNFISNIATGGINSNPCQVTSVDHSLSTGQIIYLANIVGTTQLNATLATITVVDANNFTLNGIDSTGFTAYVSGGIFNVTPSDGTTYQAGSQYAWYRFYSNQYGQYLRMGLTYDDALMNQLATHQSNFELNAINFFFKPGGRLTN